MRMGGGGGSEVRHSADGASVAESQQFQKSVCNEVTHRGGPLGLVPQAVLAGACANTICGDFLGIFYDLRFMAF